MVFNFQDDNGLKVIEADGEAHYLVRTSGKTIVKLQKDEIAIQNANNIHWPAVYFNFPRTIAFFPVYNPRAA